MKKVWMSHRDRVLVQMIRVQGQRTAIDYQIILMWERRAQELGGPRMMAMLLIGVLWARASDGRVN